MGTKGLILSLIFLTAHCLTAQTDTSLKETLTEASLLPKLIPFREVIAATTPYRVLPFDTNHLTHATLHRQLVRAATAAGETAATRGISAARPNEAGNQIESFVRAALKEAGLNAEVPTNSLGTAQSTGYPDIAISGPVSCYLELKTYNATTEDSTQRTFYYSPSEHPKVTRDAVHLLLAYELEKQTREGDTLFIPTRWRLISLENLAVELKLEFNQSNRGLYGGESGAVMLSGGEVTTGAAAGR